MHEFGGPEVLVVRVGSQALHINIYRLIETLPSIRIRE